MALPEHLVIGLTGGIGSGKTAATRCFADLGVHIIDADLISHAFSTPPSPALPQIAKEFGQEFLTTAGELDRAKMRNAAFSDPQAKVKLEAIFHPLIQQECLRLMQHRNREPYTILAVPLLFETNGFIAHIDYSLVIDCPEALQLSRVMRRSGLSEEHVLAIMKNQLGRSARLNKADYVILNDGTIDKLAFDVAQLHQTFLKLSKTL